MRDPERGRALFEHRAFDAVTEDRQPVALGCRLRERLEQQGEILLRGEPTDREIVPTGAIAHHSVARAENRPPSPLRHFSSLGVKSPQSSGAQNIFSHQLK